MENSQLRLSVYFSTQSRLKLRLWVIRLCWKLGSICPSCCLPVVSGGCIGRSICPCLLLLGFALDSAFPWARGPVLPKPSQCGSAQPPSCPVLPASLSEPAPTTLTGHPPGPLSACPVDPAWLFQPTRLQVPGLSSLGNTVTSMPQQTRSICLTASQGQKRAEAHLSGQGHKPCWAGMPRVRGPSTAP